MLCCVVSVLNHICMKYPCPLILCTPRETKYHTLSVCLSVCIFSLDCPYPTAHNSSLSLCILLSQITFPVFPLNISFPPNPFYSFLFFNFLPSFLSSFLPLPLFYSPLFFSYFFFFLFLSLSLYFRYFSSLLRLMTVGS